jgi:hypothetical protein
VPPVGPLDFADSGMAVIKARPERRRRDAPGGEGVSILETGPQRRLTLLDAGGAVRALPPRRAFLIDFAQHPSGDHGGARPARTVTLVRLDRAARSFEFPLIDPQAPTDPTFSWVTARATTRRWCRCSRATQYRAGGRGRGGAAHGRNAVVAYRLIFGTP